MNRVLLNEISECPGLYMATSFHHSNTGNKVDPVITFLVFNESKNIMAEWEITNGPVVKYVKSDNRNDPTHWYFGNVKGHDDRSKLYVDDNNMGINLANREFELIKNSLIEFLGDIDN